MAVETDVVRQQSFDAEGVVEVEVALLAGRVLVHLVDEPGVHVEIRHSPTGDSWTAGLTGLLSWVNDQFGNGRNQPAGPAEAVRDARIEQSGKRLKIQSSKSLPLRAVPLAVTVRAPQGSSVIAKAGSADVTVTGTAGKLEVQTGTGDVTADRADAPAQVNSGSGKVRLGPMLAGLRAKTGSGDIEVSSIGGNTVLYTGTGDVWLGAVQNDVQVRTGSGDVTVADAASGRIQVGTGSGDLRVGVRPGVAARVDLVSSSGSARSELEISDTPPESDAPLSVTGRTGSGNALVTTATS
jgi:Putative adhesin